MTAFQLSVTDTSKYSGLRVAAVRQHAAAIAALAAALSAADRDIAAKITAATMELSGGGFSESPESVQVLDFPLAPRVPIPEAPWEYNNGYTTNVRARGPDGKIIDGGSLVSLDDVWNELHRCFNCNFPIGGAPKEFPKVGDKLPLEMRIAGVKTRQSARGGDPDQQDG